ncbi:hypothetical protein AAF712_016408, partial [Marasmius tenuissimus]
MPMFLTQLLFSGSARIRFSEAQKEAVLAWAKALGAHNVPALSTLKKVQASIEDVVGDPTEKVVSSSGTVFYINNIAQAIAKMAQLSQDFSNPITRFAMAEYRQDGRDGMSELRNGKKWLLNLQRDLLTVTARVDDKNYFVGELLRRRQGSVFIPDRFFMREEPDVDRCRLLVDVLYAVGNDVQCTPNGFVVGRKMFIPTADFKETFEDLSRTGSLDCGFSDCSKSYESRMPHPRREAANGRMVYGVPLIIFLDDVSGNISKQWNKHHAIYMSNALLPRQMIEKEFCTRFVMSSPHATPMELVKALKDSIGKAAKNGVEAYDCKHNKECLLVPHAHFWGSDNPMQAEECSHGGLQCNFFCRTCEVGGTQEEKQSDKGFLCLFEAGTPQTPEKTANHIQEQARLSALHGATDKLRVHKSATGVSDSMCGGALQAIVELGKAMYARKHPGSANLKKEEVQAILEEEVKHVIELHGINPLIGMPGIDIHQDTPTEILHTILLGVVKYFWGQTVHILEKNKEFSTFQVCLASVDISGLNIPKLSADYICAYKGSLIGKHFKSLAQLMPFLIYNLVPSKVLDAWTIIGELVVLVWHTEIEDLEDYLCKLSTTIQAFLNITAECSPSILVSKPKFHFLVHLPAYIRRFGPALIFSTERYELFNHVFRLSCIYSNRQAPSRDSCRAFASQDTTKHIVTGGSWINPTTGKWVHAGEKILAYMHEKTHFRKLLAIPGDTNEAPPGVATLPSASERHDHGILSWATTNASKASNFSNPMLRSLSNKQFLSAISLIATNGDRIRCNSFAAIDYQGKSYIGRVSEILVDATEPWKAVAITLECFDFVPEPHNILHMPVISPSDEFCVVESTDILSALNVQHDCVSGECVDYKDILICQE